MLQSGSEFFTSVADVGAAVRVRVSVAERCFLSHVEVLSIY